MFTDTKTIIGAALLVTAVTACKPKDYFDPDAYKEIISSAFPVSGVDPQHQWKLMRTVTARITVNWYYPGNYRVDIYASDPMAGATALLMGGGTVPDGATLSTPLSCPMTGPETVFVALTTRAATAPSRRRDSREGQSNVGLTVAATDRRSRSPPTASRP